MNVETLYLSRRNLETLISKLNRKKKGDKTECTIIKYANNHPKFEQTMDTINVIAIENDECYSERSAGPVCVEDITYLT